MKSCAVAVVGHVDHGKTSLVRALTGQDTDGLKEEKARGLSITLGFAYRNYATGVIDFIDSPGHEDFIRAMVCGSTGAQAALVVISAVDGVERQTREHLEILRHLDVRCGVVALTKADLVPPEDRPYIRELVVEALDGSPFVDEPQVFCSEQTGEGLDTLNQALEALIHRAPGASALPGAFLPIDRAFALKGVGAVATGTLLGAPITLADDAHVQPVGLSAAVRRLQSRGTDVERATPGMRAAVNLRGVKLEDLRRGDVICTGGAFQAASQVDAWVSIEPDRGTLKHGTDVRVMVGTASQVATAYVWGERKSIEAGGAYVRLRFHDRIATHVSQRGILRRLSPVETLGGVLVLDPAPPVAPRRDPLRMAVLEAVHRGGPREIAAALEGHGRGIIARAELLRLAGTDPDGSPDLAALGFEMIGAHHVASWDTIAKARRRYLEAVSDGLSRQPGRGSLPTADIHSQLRRHFADTLLDHVVQGLLETGELSGDRTMVAIAASDPFASLGDAGRARLDRIEKALREDLMNPPGLSALQGEKGQDADLVDLLAKSGRAVFLRNIGLKQTLVFHIDALNVAHGMLESAFPPPATFTMADARAALATSRKYAIPLLEHFDKVGLTRRNGDVRVLVKRKV